MQRGARNTQKRDMFETKEPGKEKKAGAISLKMYSVDNQPSYKQHTAPADQIIARSIKINVKDLIKTDPTENLS